MAFTAVFDADVLHPAAQRDLLVRLAQVRLFRGRWTERILEEMERSVVARQPQHAGKLRPRTKNILTNPTGSSDWVSITHSCRSDFTGVCPRLTMNSAQMTQPIPRVTPTKNPSTMAAPSRIQGWRIRRRRAAASHRQTAEADRLGRAWSLLDPLCMPAGLHLYAGVEAGATVDGSLGCRRDPTGIARHSVAPTESGRRTTSGCRRRAPQAGHPTVDESCSTPITTPTACHSSTSSAAGATVDDPSARGSPAAASRRASRSVWSSSVALISRNPACISARRLPISERNSVRSSVNPDSVRISVHAHCRPRNATLSVAQCPDCQSPCGDAGRVP